LLKVQESITWALHGSGTTGVTFAEDEQDHGKLKQKAVQQRISGCVAQQLS
jgi:hypothetical protein